MFRFKLTVLSAATAILAWMPPSPAAAAGPLLVPWAVGHLIGAAARLAAVPFIAGSTMRAQAPPSAEAASYYASPGYYVSSGYSPRGYYASPAYSSPPPYYVPPRTAGAYHGWPQYYYPALGYRGPAPYLRPMPQFPDPRRGYSAPGMRYSGPYGGQVFGPSRAFAHRR
jgi:hypothetical protein